MKFDARRRARPAVSELVGLVLAIAVTVIAGAATWSFARSEAAASEGTLQNNVQNTNNYLGEQFKVIYMTFPSTTQVVIWIYNVGTLTFSPFQIRLYDSSGLINLLYNYTASGSTKTNWVFDLMAGTPYYYTTCQLAGSSYETPTISASTLKTSNAMTIALTIPSAVTNCPSYGQTLQSGTGYTVVVTGLYGNVFTYYQAK